MFAKRPLLKTERENEKSAQRGPDPTPPEQNFVIYKHQPQLIKIIKLFQLFSLCCKFLWTYFFMELAPSTCPKFHFCTIPKP